MSQEEMRAAVEQLEQPEVEQTVQLSEVEQEAYKEGWRPESEFEGEKNKWIPADEFMRRKPLFAKIDELKSENYHTRKEVQELRGAFKALTEHHKKVQQTEYERAVKTLQAERRAAAADHDVERVLELDDQLDQVKEEKREFDAQVHEVSQPAVTPTPEYLDWVKNNSWYMTDKEMHDTADGLGYSFVRANPNATPQQVYAYVTDKVQKAYPEKFQQPKKPSPVDSGSSQNRAPNKGFRRLTAEEDQVARTWERLGVMSRDEYIAELRKLEEK